MSLWRQLTHGLRVLANRKATDQEIDEEVSHYFEEVRANFEASGLSAEEARRAAQLELGQAQAVRETVRSHGWENAIETTISDVRYGARRLFQKPMFALIAALTLALGIGASTAIFSVVNPILFETLPYPEAERLVMIWDNQSGTPLDVTFGTYREVLARSRIFEAFAVERPVQATLTSVAEPERLSGQYVNSDYFRALGVRPALGRDFLSSEDQPKQPFVVIISDGLWHRQFGGDRDIIGKQVLFDEVPVTVVGVMPKDFENVLNPSAEVWATLQYDSTLPFSGREWGHHLHLVGRLREGVGLEEARRELDSIARNRQAEFPRHEAARLEKGFITRQLQDDLTRPVQPYLFAVFGAAVLLLTLACVNVANLLMSRGIERRSELAVRAALGASRLRLTRQLFAECAVLASIGGLFGIVLAHAAVDALIKLGPPGLPRLGLIEVDGSALAFALVLTTLVGLSIGIVPALQATAAEKLGAVQERSMRVAARQPITGRVLVTLQVAMAVVLLVCSGLLLRTVQEVFAVHPGFEPSNLLTMQVPVAGARFNDPVVTEQFFSELLSAVKNVPGVTAAAFSSQLPLSGDVERWGVQPESVPKSKDGEGSDAYRSAVSPGYFETMGIRLRAGRFLDNTDTASSPLSVVINESYARRLLPGLKPVGQRLRIGPSPWYTVVGVVEDVKHTSLVLDRADIVYTTAAQWTRFADRAKWLVVRSGQDASALTPAIRQAILSVNKRQPILKIATMSDRLSQSVAERTFALRMFSVFGAVALIMALIGTYGLLSFSVSQRTREMGVRSALGGSRRQIVALVLRQGMVLTGIGALIGMIGSALASRALVTLLFGVSRGDAATYAGVLVLLVIISALACAVPALRAARISPSIALRAE